MKVKPQVNGVQTNKKGKPNKANSAIQRNSSAGVTKNVITSKKKQKSNLQNGKEIKIQSEVTKENNDTLKVVSPNVLKTGRKRNRKHKKKSGELSTKDETEAGKIAVVTNKTSAKGNIKVQLKKKVNSGGLPVKDETQEGKAAAVTNINGSPAKGNIKIKLNKKNKVKVGALSPEVMTDKKSPTKAKKKNRRKKSKAGKQQDIHQKKTVTVEKKDTIPEPPNSTDSDASSENGESQLNESVQAVIDDENTVFVGNLPNNVTPKAVKQFFKKYGKIISVRLRSAAQPDKRISKKVAIIRQTFHKDSNSINAMVNFDQKFQARDALEANGSLFEGHHIRVDYCNSSKEQHNNRISIFIGNLPFAVKDDELWKVFENCGEIESVRVIRDKVTRIGKGFGYVNFKSPDGVELALQLEDVFLHNRKLRIARAAEPKTGQQSNKKVRSKKRKISKSEDNDDADNVEKKQKSIQNDEENLKKKNFQGAKSADRRIKKQTLKKKVKKMRNEKHKKAIASLLTSKSGKGFIKQKKNKEA